MYIVKGNNRTAHCQCSLFSNKNPIIRIFCLSGSLAAPFNPDKWSSTVFTKRVFGTKQFRFSKILTKRMTYKAGLSKENEVSAVTLKPEATPTAQTDVWRSEIEFVGWKFSLSWLVCLFVLNICL